MNRLWIFGFSSLIILIAGCGEDTRSWRERFPTAEEYKAAIDESRSMIIHGADLDNAFIRWEELIPYSKDPVPKERRYWLDFQFEIVQKTQFNRYKSDLRIQAISQLEGYALMNPTNVAEYVPWFQEKLQEEGYLEKLDDFEAQLFKEFLKKATRNSK